MHEHPGGWYGNNVKMVFLCVILAARPAEAAEHRVVAERYWHTFSAAHPVLLSLKPGDSIVIVSSHKDWNEAEQRTIASHPSGNTLTLTSPLSYSHTGVVKSYGDGTRTWTADLRAQVGLPVGAVVDDPQQLLGREPGEQLRQVPEPAVGDARQEAVPQGRVPRRAFPRCRLPGCGWVAG